MWWRSTCAERAGGAGEFLSYSGSRCQGVATGGACEGGCRITEMLWLVDRFLWHATSGPVNLCSCWHPCSLCWAVVVTHCSQGATKLAPHLTVPLCVWLYLLPGMAHLPPCGFAEVGVCVCVCWCWCEGQCACVYAGACMQVRVCRCSTFVCACGCVQELNASSTNVSVNDYLLSASKHRVPKILEKIAYGKKCFDSPVRTVK